MEGDKTTPSRPFGDVTRRGFFGRLLGGLATVVLAKEARLSRTFRVRNPDGTVREEMTFAAITEREHAKILEYLSRRWGVTNWRNIAKRQFPA